MVNSNVHQQALTDLNTVAQLIKTEVAGILRHAIAVRGQAHLMVSGGNTPKAYLAALSDARDIDWSLVTVSFADERFVDTSHPNSNEGMARSTFGRAGEHVNWAGLRGSAGVPALAAQHATDRYNGLPWPADVSLLGVGEDGHIASLFPSEALPVDANMVFSTHSSDGDKRLSLTPGWLLCTNIIYLIAGGAEKAAVLDRAIKPGAVSDLPVRHLLHQATTPVHIVTFGACTCAPKSQ